VQSVEVYQKFVREQTGRSFANSLLDLRALPWWRFADTTAGLRPMLFSDSVAELQSNYSVEA